MESHCLLGARLDDFKFRYEEDGLEKIINFSKEKGIEAWKPILRRSLSQNQSKPSSN